MQQPEILVCTLDILWKKQTHTSCKSVLKHHGYTGVKLQTQHFIGCSITANMIPIHIRILAFRRTNLMTHMFICLLLLRFSLFFYGFKMLSAQESNPLLCMYEREWGSQEEKTNIVFFITFFISRAKSKYLKSTCINK